MPEKLLMALAVPVAILSMVAGASFALIKMVDITIQDVAEQRAVEWAQTVTPILLDQPETALAIDEISLAPAFENSRNAHNTLGIFNVRGQVIGGAQTLQATAADLVAAKVAQTGEISISHVGGVDDTGKSQSLFKVYIPIKNDDGATLAVAHASLDATMLFEKFHSGAIKLSIILSTVFAAVMLLLYAGFLHKRQREIKSQSRAEYLSRYDSISGLLNRAGITERATEVLGSESSGGARRAFLYVDIDHFKRINDILGHRAGDRFIRHVGEAISLCLRAGDIAGRIGGDEFVIITQYEDQAEVTDLVTRLQLLVAKPIFDYGRKVSATLSIGIELGDDVSRSVSERLHRADLALYQAKSDGRDNYSLFTADLEQKAERQQLIETSVIDGLESGLFAVHFQPLIDARTSRFVGCEALLRLTTASGEEVSPSEFIPIAESVGAIKQLGTWCLARAAETFARLPNEMFIAVNLSARQFDDGDLPAIVRNILNTTGLNASRLELEVTESLLLENTAAVREQLDAVRKLGVSVALDDFGAGQSSLGELWNFGFDKLKIDRSFVCGLDDSKGSARARVILNSIIELAHGLDMVVTAEGIESTAQAAALKELACDQLQGYLYARPIPAGELPQAFLSLTSSQLAASHAPSDIMPTRSAESREDDRQSLQQAG